MALSDKRWQYTSESPKSTACQMGRQIGMARRGEAGTTGNVYVCRARWLKWDVSRDPKARD